MSDFGPSVLGTLGYWDGIYQKELEDFRDNEDPGTEWFGHNVAKRIVKWVKESNILSKESTIIDIGCGNGLLLLELAKLGYTNLCGVDYSKGALKLAKNIFNHEKIPEDVATWLELDITNQTIVESENEPAIMKVCNDAVYKRACYIEQVKQFLSKRSGILLITSCNWTTAELLSHFMDFKLLEELPAPTFTFGGKTGKTVSSCVFKLLA
ncbi:EEF1A lysine methyltransferase 2-like isoform X3 [Clavelina lepadiformis]|uniref:EEF1A lysine methyltransferase 2-like isoform X3 n=1 Tax=Clavelina lepadiformis TaxID=159417 RepID=UPI0040437F7E